MKTVLSILAAIVLILAGCSETDTLSPVEKEALHATLMDEYKAEATYASVMEQFGDVRPFSNIINAEQRHSSRIELLYAAYNLPIPEAEEFDIPAFNSLQEACSAGVEAEIDNVALYNSYLDRISKEDIKQVFTQLRDASDFNHLPAFRRCAE